MILQAFAFPDRNFQKSGREGAGLQVDETPRRVRHNRVSPNCQLTTHAAGGRILQPLKEDYLLSAQPQSRTAVATDTPEFAIPADRLVGVDDYPAHQMDIPPSRM